MALTDQPYLKLYVDDWMNNTNLKFCSAGAHGLMMSVMCIMHKAPTYGHILLKQKFKQTDKQINNFARQLDILLPFHVTEIEKCLQELLENNVLSLEDDTLICKRMIKDNKSSTDKALAGKNGGFSTQNKIKSAKAEVKADCDNDNGIESYCSNIKEGEDEKIKISELKPVGLKDPIVPEMLKIFLIVYPDYLQNDLDYQALRLIAIAIKKQLKLSSGVSSFENDDKKLILKFWKDLVEFSATHVYYRTIQLSTVNKQISGLIKTFMSSKTPLPVKKLSGKDEYERKRLASL